MDKRAITIGVVVSMVALVLSRLISSSRRSVMQHIDVEAGLVFVDSLYQLASTLQWLPGGILVGYLCAGKVIKNGAITGTLYGVLFCLLGLIMFQMDPDTRGQIEFAHVLRLAATVAQYAFLFVLSTCLGFALKAGRAHS